MRFYPSLVVHQPECPLLHTLRLSNCVKDLLKTAWEAWDGIESDAAGLGLAFADIVRRRLLDLEGQLCVVLYVRMDSHLSVLASQISTSWPVRVEDSQETHSVEFDNQRQFRFGFSFVRTRRLLGHAASSLRADPYYYFFLFAPWIRSVLELRRDVACSPNLGGQWLVSGSW